MTNDKVLEWVLSLLEMLDEATRVATTARDFIWEPETWESYLEVKESQSHSLPVEFVNLGNVIEEFYGPPPKD